MNGNYLRRGAVWRPRGESHRTRRRGHAPVDAGVAQTSSKRSCGERCWVSSLERTQPSALSSLQEHQQTVETQRPKGGLISAPAVSAQRQSSVEHPRERPLPSRAWLCRARARTHTDTLKRIKNHSSKAASFVTTFCVGSTSESSQPSVD